MQIDEKAFEAARAAWLESASDYTRLDDSIKAAILAYESAKPKEGWRDIASAPKDGTAILLYGPGVLNRDGRTSMYARAQHVGWAHDVDGHLLWYTRDPRVTCRPTHWRPLPDPPSAMLSAAGDGE